MWVDQVVLSLWKLGMGSREVQLVLLVGLGASVVGQFFCRVGPAQMHWGQEAV